jgi:hypothetical protein
MIFDENAGLKLESGASHLRMKAKVWFFFNAVGL